MKVVKFNESNLQTEEIDKTVSKVRGIIINNDGKALVVKYAGIYMLPGGSIEEGEDSKIALKRELEEESGIEIDTNDATPFLEIESYDKDYYDRKAQRKINRLTQTIFYKLKTDKDIDESKKRLTQSEKERDFKIEYMNLSVIRYLVETNNTNNPKRKQFDREILTALNEFARLNEREKEELEK